MIIVQTILTLSPFLFRASGISKTSWLGCSKIQLAAKKEIFWKESKPSDAQAFNVISFSQTSQEPKIKG